MKKKIFIYILSLALSTFPVYSAMAEDNYVLPWKEAEITEVTYDEYGWPTVHFIVPYEELMSNAEAENPERETIPPLTEAPEVGTTLGKILKDGDNLDLRDSSSYTEAYRYGTIGQCVWYAEGRFLEVHGISMPFFLGPIKDWIDNSTNYDTIKSITDLTDVPEQSIAVFKPANGFEDWPGHVEFVEYVERDESGNPIKVYFTDANGTGDLNKGIFDPGYDGVVKEKTYDEFINQYGVELIGYIVPNEL